MDNYGEMFHRFPYERWFVEQSVEHWKTIERDS
jgi:hypothetical protein